MILVKQLLGLDNREERFVNCKQYVLLIVILVVFCYYMNDHAISQEYHNDKIESDISKPFNIRGDYLKAAMVAGEDFQKYLDKRLKNSSSPTAHHMSNICNYSVTISKEARGGQYKVEFSPRPILDSPIKGGGASYVVDSKSFKIVNKNHSM